MKKFTSKALLIICALCLAFCLCALVACNKDSGDDTSADTTEAPTEAATTEELTTADDSEESTDADTTVETTEQTTELETTLGLPEDKPTDPAHITFCDSPLNENFIKVSNAATTEIVTDEEQGTVIKLSAKSASKTADPFIQLNYTSYMNLAGLQPISRNSARFALLHVKLEGVSITGANINFTVYAKEGDSTKNLKATATYDRANNGWQYVLIPLYTDDVEGTLTAIRFDFLDKPAKVGEAVYLKSISFFDSKGAAISTMSDSLLSASNATVVIPGLTNEYTFVHITDTHVSAYSDEEAALWTPDRLNYNKARREIAFVANGIMAEDRFPLHFDYANSIGADGVFLTGDLIDFPSEKSIEMLYNNATKYESIKPIFCLGNHDWTFADDYMSSNAMSTYIPRFNELCGGDPEITVAEYDEFLVVAVDNSRDVIMQSTVDKFMALYEKNKPIILLLHIPLHAETLAPDVMATWGGRNITMGIGAMGSDWQSVRDFYTAVCLAEDTPVVAVFAGHVHFNHEDSFPNGVKQYVTGAGYMGDIRVVTIKGEN